MSKKVIFNDAKAHQTDLNKQTEMKDCINLIEKEALKIGVEFNDYRFIEKADPITLIRESYWAANKHMFPAGITMDKALSNTEFDSKVVSDAYGKYQLLSKSVKPLSIEKENVDITIKASDYDWYLNEDKKELHTALDKFIKAAESLNKHITVNPWSLQRAISGEGTMVINGSLVINPYTFKA